MKLSLYYFQTQKAAWSMAASETYFQKINRMNAFELIPLKSKSADRDDRSVKLRAEEKALLEKLSDRDELVLFDPQGKRFDSRGFSKFLKTKSESGKARICFAIGGPYGFSDKVKDRAEAMVSLSDLTMNHHVALAVALEQVYRALTIDKNIPYHNE